MSTRHFSQNSHFVTFLDCSRFVIYSIKEVVNMRIKEIRLKRNLSQRELAASLKIAPNTLSQYENAKREPDLRTLELIADVLDVSVDQLLGRDDFMNYMPARLKEAMEDKGWDCKQFAQKLKGSEKSISLYLERKRKPSKNTLDLMALHLGVNPEWFYDFYAPKYEKPAPENGDGPSETAKRFMGLVDRLTTDQQQLLLTQLRAWTEQNQRQATAAPPSGEETHPESAL